MRRYEQIYILRPALSEDEISRVVENTNQLILDDGGAVIFLNKWGMRKLAYPIKKELQGYYILCDFAATPEVVAEIERKFRIDDAVLKYLTVRVSDAISAEEISAAISEAEALATAEEVEDEAGDDDQQEDKAEAMKSEPEEDKAEAAKSEPEEEKPGPAEEDQAETADSQDKPVADQ
jgi:small subunit ribosomal protein S6